MDITSRYDLEVLQNRSMEIVLRAAGCYLDAHAEFCRCQQCVIDLLAFTLNHVTPVYGTSLLGSLSGNSRVLGKVEIEVEMALEEGARRIGRHPGHLEPSGGGDP